MKLPRDLSLGTATSATQIEGGCTTSDWWAFAHAAGGDVPDVACDHWNRFREDVALQAKLGMQSHRLSIEWARVEPSEGRFDDAALDRYREEAALLRASGIEPMVTLHHFSFPTWLAERGGAIAGDLPDRFARFTERVVRALERDVTQWVTINEPNVLVAQGFLLGVWPPGERSPLSTVRAVRTLRRAHVEAYRAIHALQPRALVGLAHHVRVATPATRSVGDRLAARALDLAFNEPFLDLPQDFVGLNYYSRDVVRFDRHKPAELFAARSVPAGAAVSDLGWEIFPEGLGQVLRALAKKRKPIWITENGIADAKDEKRERFIVDHLREVARAIEDGVDVRGYLHWSLLDNFEWAEGYAPRFGLYEVDYATQKRTLRPSGEAYARITATREV
ncbi:MAG TPA: family 1 glycosylhydrolase [Polyangiaceae bacterium]